MRKLPTEVAVASASRQFAVHNYILRTSSQSWKLYLQDLDASVRKEVNPLLRYSLNIVGL